MAKKKKDKEKITYVDDNSTIADMSSVNRKGEKREPPPKSTFKQKWATYLRAVKSMLIPMCIVLIVLCILYFLFMYLGGNF